MSAAQAARELIGRSIVCDGTLPWRPYGDPTKRLETLDRFAQAGFSFVSLTLASTDQTIEETIRLIARERAYLRTHADQYVLAESAADIQAAKAAGKLALGFHFQGPNALTQDLAMVEVYRRLGVRHMGLAYNLRNAVGDGCHEPGNAGLSLYGHKLIATMEEAGVVVDLSHVGYATARDALLAARRPAMFSHSNPLALVDHERNIPDELALACARAGGVVGANGMSTFLPGGRATAEAMVRVIDHWVRLLGPEHVSLGFDHVYDWPGLQANLRVGGAAKHPPGKGYEDPSVTFIGPEHLQGIVEGLLALDYRDTTIQAVLGGNWLRVMGSGA